MMFQSTFGQKKEKKNLFPDDDMVLSEIIYKKRNETINIENASSNKTTKRTRT